MTFIGDPSVPEPESADVLAEQLENLRNRNGAMGEQLRASQVALDPVSVLFSRMDALAEVALSSDVDRLRFEIAFELKMSELMATTDQAVRRQRLVTP